MTRILFSNLPWWTTEGGSLRQGIRAGSRWPFTRHAVHRPDEFRWGGYLPFPFFLAHAASYAAREIPGAEVTLRDSVARGESHPSFNEAYLQDVPEWVVIETATPSAAHDVAYAELLAIRSKVILTGTIVADRGFTLPPWATAAIRGEYEKGVVKVIRDGARGIIDFDLLTKDEMNSLPAPMEDPACIGRYWDACPVLDGADRDVRVQAPHLQIWTSRGCPFKCVFCAWPATMTGNDPDGTNPRSVRGHSPEWLEAMIRERIASAAAIGLEYQSIYLDDDTFNLTTRHTLAVCEVMARIGLPWSAMCRADTITEEAWKAMRAAGCFGVKVGVESGSQRVIDQIVNKRMDLAKLENYWLPLLQSLGFNVHTTWTEGLPGETDAERQQTHDMIARLYAKGLHRTHQLSGTSEITGTPMHSLRVGGEALPKYPGALAGECDGKTDGQRKVEEMHV